MRQGEPPERMTPTAAHEQTRLLVQAAAAVCDDKKGNDTRILELDPVDSGLSDFFLVTSATNDRQAIAIADEIEARLKRDFGVYANSVEGRRQGEWILLDYVDFVVHVFLAERRAFYDIERLRKSARPLTPAEFDAELKEKLAARTRAARGQAEKKTAASATSKNGTKSSGKPAAKKSTARTDGAHSAPATKKKAAAKTAPAKKKAPTKRAAKATAARGRTSGAKKRASGKR
jgi:ribosome-associated protein